MQRVMVNKDCDRPLGRQLVSGVIDRMSNNRCLGSVRGGRFSNDVRGDIHRIILSVCMRDCNSILNSSILASEFRCVAPAPNETRGEPAGFIFT